VGFFPHKPKDASFFVDIVRSWMPWLFEDENAPSPNEATYMQLALEQQWDYRFAFTKSPEILSHLKITQDAVMVFMPPRLVSKSHGDRKRARYGAEQLNKQGLMSFIETHNTPLVALLTSRNLNRYRTPARLGTLPLFTLFVGASFDPGQGASLPGELDCTAVGESVSNLSSKCLRFFDMLRDVAVKFKGKMRFVVAPRRATPFRSDMVLDYGLVRQSHKAAPWDDVGLGIQLGWQHYRYGGDAEQRQVSVETVTEFVETFLAGGEGRDGLEFKSKARSSGPSSMDGGDGDVMGKWEAKVISDVGGVSELKELLSAKKGEEGSGVLLQIFSSEGCKACQQFRPEYAELADRMRVDAPNIAITRIDVAATAAEATVIATEPDEACHTVIDEAYKIAYDLDGRRYGYPSLYFIRTAPAQGVVSDPLRPVRYDGALEAGSIASFIQWHAPGGGGEQQQEL
jgi:hypothetical protein